MHAFDKEGKWNSYIRNKEERLVKAQRGRNNLKHSVSHLSIQLTLEVDVFMSS